MEQNTTYQLRVGIFATLGIVALVVTILSLGGNQSFITASNFYKVKLSTVQGLNKGSVVSLSGINVGNVSEIEYSAQEHAIIVHFSVEKKYIQQITKSSVAEVRTQGALGDKYIFVSVGQPNEEPLANGDFVTANEGGDLLDMLASKSGDMGKVFEIINEVYKISKAINANGRPETIMSNLAAASESIKIAAKDGQILMSELKGQPAENVKNAFARFDSLMTKIDSGQGSLGALINDPTLHDQLKGFLGGSSQRRSSMKTLIRSSLDK